MTTITIPPPKRVINVGLNKTGTTSVRQALSTLGFSSLLPSNARDFQVTKAWWVQGRVDDILDAMQHRNNICDHPTPWMLDQIMDDPELRHSAIFATKRASFEDWYASLSRHVAKKGPAASVEIWYGRRPAPDPETTEYFKQVYQTHYHHVDSYDIPMVCIEDLNWTTLADVLGLELTPQQLAHLGKFPWDRKTKEN